MLERLRHLHFGWLYFASILVTVIYLFLLNNTAHPDLWGRMAVGALYEYNDGTFPHHDVFSYTAPNSLDFNHEWGAGMLYYWLVKIGGSASLFWLQVVLYSATLAMALRLILKAFKASTAEALKAKEMGFIIFFPVLSFLMCSLYFLTLWTHDFTFFFYILFLSILEHCRSTKRHRLLLILPLLLLVWVNFHGGFIVGFFLIGIYLLRAFALRDKNMLKMLGVSLALCGIATLITPYGMDYLRHMWEFWCLDRTGVSDWAWVFSNKLPPFQPFYGLFYSVSLLFWVAIALYDWKKQGLKQFPWPLILILATGYEGFIHYKLVPLFCLTVLGVGFQLSFPSLSKLLLKCSSVPEGFKQRLHVITSYLMPLALLIASGYMVITLSLSRPHPFAVQVSDHRGMGYPIGAVNYLKRNQIQGNLWSTFIWGEFLYWNLYPDMKVAMDGRFETVYPMSFYKEFMDFATPPHDLSIPLKYGTTHLLVPNNDVVNAEFFEAIKKTSLWHEVYRDPNAVLYSAKALTLNETSEVHTEKSLPLTVDDFFQDFQRFKSPLINFTPKGDTKDYKKS